ncbi:MAG: hypothetical protein VKO39_05045 [Cyanobacteriota bacterium]|nr:hypothetical protein [Cyanobacteriota bacterium]
MNVLAADHHSVWDVRFSVGGCRHKGRFIRCLLIPRQPSLEVAYKMTQGVVVPTGLHQVHDRNQIKAEGYGVGQHRYTSLFQRSVELLLVNKPPRTRWGV